MALGTVGWLATIRAVFVQSAVRRNNSVTTDCTDKTRMVWCTATLGIPTSCFLFSVQRHEKQRLVMAHGMAGWLATIRAVFVQSAVGRNNSGTTDCTDKTRMVWCTATLSMPTSRFLF